MFENVEFEMVQLLNNIFGMGYNFFMILGDFLNAPLTEFFTYNCEFYNPFFNNTVVFGLGSFFEGLGFLGDVVSTILDLLLDIQLFIGDFILDILGFPASFDMPIWAFWLTLIPIFVIVIALIKGVLEIVT